jgi:hypothetical protein
MAFEIMNNPAHVLYIGNKQTKQTRGLSPHANYTDWATAAGRRS